MISTFVAEDPMFSFESSLFYFRIGVFSCFIWYLIDKDKNILNYFYYILVLTFSALIIDGYSVLPEKPSGIQYKSNTYFIFFWDELIMGSYLSRLFPLLFALFIIKQKQKYEIYYIGLLFILVDLLIYISGERSAFLFKFINLVYNYFNQTVSKIQTNYFCYCNDFSFSQYEFDQFMTGCLNPFKTWV